MQPGFMKVAEVAKLMRVSGMTVYRLIHNGELPAVRVGRSFRVAEKEVEKYLAGAVHETGSYADKVNAPLPEATISAINEELASGTYARYKRKN